MNKSLLMIASLALGTAAVAQDQPAGAPTQGSPPAANTPAGPESQTPAPSGNDPAAAPAGQPSDVTSPSPGAANPMAGGASGGNMSQAQQSASSTDTSAYPKCSRSVTDKCVSAGGSGRGGMHKRGARRHK